MSNTYAAQVKELLQDEYLGTSEYGTYRPDITLENLDVSKVDKSKILKDDFCDCVRIPMLPTENEELVYKFMFCYLVDKISIGNDVYSQPINLFLCVDDNDGERKYYIGADVQIEDWDGITTEVSMEEIHPIDKELAAIELALLKVTNPEEYLRKYTRAQIAQLPQIANKFGFFGDGILNDGSYRSTWLTEDNKTCMLAYVQNCKDDKSKVQLLKIGNQ